MREYVCPICGKTFHLHSNISEYKWVGKDLSNNRVIKLCGYNCMNEYLRRRSLVMSELSLHHKHAKYLNDTDPLKIYDEYIKSHSKLQGDSDNNDQE